jgi:hypothetical protein
VSSGRSTRNTVLAAWRSSAWLPSCLVRFAAVVSWPDRHQQEPWLASLLEGEEIRSRSGLEQAQTDVGMRVGGPQTILVTSEQFLPFDGTGSVILGTSP